MRSRAAPKTGAKTKHRPDIPHYFRFKKSDAGRHDLDRNVICDHAANLRSAIQRLVRFVVPVGSAPDVTPARSERPVQIVVDR